MSGKGIPKPTRYDRGSVNTEQLKKDSEKTKSFIPPENSKWTNKPQTKDQYLKGIEGVNWRISGFRAKLFKLDPSDPDFEEKQKDYNQFLDTANKPEGHIKIYSQVAPEFFNGAYFILVHYQEIEYLTIYESEKES